MNTRKINFELVEIEFNDLQEILEQLDDPSKIPDEQTCFFLTKVISNRKSLENTVKKPGKELVKETVLQALRIPFNELEKKQKDSEALIKLGDCYFFGLLGIRQCNKNRNKSERFYLESAKLNNPEAMSMLGYFYYTKMLERIDLNDNEPIPFPTSQVPTSYLSHTQPYPFVQYPTKEWQLLYKDMWNWLEKCVNLNYVTNFIIQMASDSQIIRKGEQLKPNIKRELIKFNIKQYKELQENFAFSCGNPICTFKFKDDKNLISCAKCNNLKYCSKNCQISHWVKHKEICKQTGVSQNQASPTKVSESHEKTSQIFSFNIPGQNQTLIFETNSMSRNGFKQFQENLKPEDRMSLILSRTRLASLQNTMSLDEIKHEIDRMLNRQSYTCAIKFINLAIDKMRLKIPLYSMTSETQKSFLELYSKRVECNFRIGQLRRAQRFYDLALDDCIFVLETGVFDEISCLAYYKIKEFKTTIESEGIQRNSHSSTRPNGKTKKMIKENLYGDLRVYTCSNLIRDKIALNAQIDYDSCPFCSIQWSKFIEPSLAVVLPCDHACCVKCMINYRKICKESIEKEEEEEIPSDSSCALCRQLFSPAYLDEICQVVIKDRTIPSLFNHLKKLPLGKEEGDKLIFKLLMDNEFDINKIEGILFSMVGMVQADKGKDLDWEQKQEYFELAREPVRKLANEFLDLKNELNEIYDMESLEWIEKYKNLEEIKEMLNMARMNAANDIYERMNSTSKMGSVINDGAIVQVDLHGLYVNEAIEKVKEFVMPMLSVLEKILLITGHGLHNQSGQAVLKDGLKEYFKSINIKCQDVENNKGAFLIFSC
ncbi:unnamed protein product [Brachionus calyciflorus]|uniref:Uncharacterized protein n=1 Tax=Brachionus calyciflorus TaxID=104777 RepID=A0A814DX74_9BILA|nr:unnamed protein product [Brachionus calyciflorus]